MTQKVHCVWLQAVDLDQLSEGQRLYLEVTVSLLFISLKVLNKFEELLTPSLLKETHEVGAKSFLVVTRDLLYGASW